MDDLTSKLRQVEKVFDINSILNRNSNKTSEIARYYKNNRIAYTLFNSHDGFVHMGISENGTFSDKDFYKQAKLVQKSITITRALNVLELATGKGATLRYLSSINPNVKFYGIDLPDGQLKIKASKTNIYLSYGDYHNLNSYADESMDVIYVIEALCHAEDKKQVISEVYRVLKPDGHFIIVDGYFKQDFASMTEQEQLACRLIFKSMMVTENNQGYDDLKHFLDATGFYLDNSVDYSTNIMPSLMRLEHKAKRLIDHPRLAKIIVKATGEILAANAVAGYLFPVCVKKGLFEYRYTLAIKTPSKTRT